MLQNKIYSKAYLLLFIVALFLPGKLIAQDAQYKLSGTVLEASSGNPMVQAVVSVSSNGAYSITDEEGKFSVNLTMEKEKVTVTAPGYHLLEVFASSGQDVVWYVTKLSQVSGDVLYNIPGAKERLKDATSAIQIVQKSDIENTAASSVEHSIAGRFSGMHTVEHSGMPGHSTWMNMRGVSSIFARNEPLVFVDGMLQEISYPNNYILEGQLLNPMNIVDVEDVVDITAVKSGEGQLGSIASNGMLYVNTEQKGEASAAIIFRAYGGVSLAPDQIDVLNADQFKGYFNDLLSGQGYTVDQVNSMYPWLNTDSWSEKFRYNNNTNWQDETFKPSGYQKYYLFMKGGDDIATYNISTGYLSQGASYEDWKYTRYNLRLNGKINITKRLTIVPNTKIALSDYSLTNMGPTAEWNPVSSTLLKSPLMIANEVNPNGVVLFPLDDVGAFNVSNPVSLIQNAMGVQRNFQLLFSTRLNYKITDNLEISNVIGTGMNNDRVNMFLPDIGIVQIDSAKNSPMDMVTEYRSFQNHATINYRKVFDSKHHLNLQAGMRVMSNSYKNSIIVDLNTPSDDFRSAGQGSQYEYLKSSDGEIYDIKWVSYFTNLNYSYFDKYYFRTSLSYDASSVFNDQNRYNFYPSISGAWRLSSEDFMQNVNVINDLKLRASYAITGNMFSNIYNYSKLTYTGRRYNEQSVAVIDYYANQDMEVEKMGTLNAGLDITLAKKALNLHFDYYASSINNLIINQSLPYNFGFTDYYDNGGKMSMNGIEASFDGNISLGNSSLILAGSFAKQQSVITELNFINPETFFITRDVEGASYIAEVDGPVNSFYGYRTLGVYSTDAEAAGMIGPNGREMQGGDMIFEDLDENNRIDENDKQVIGDPNPDIFGSFSAAYKLKNWTVSAFFTYSVGNDVFNYVDFLSTSMDSYANQSKAVLDRWKQDGDQSDLPRAAIGDPSGNNVFSDRWIEDGSYLRLKELKISYNAQSFFGLQKPATIYLSAANLLTITQYSGYDPETMYFNDPFYMGIDYGKLPHTKSVILGIQVSL